jgi:hypothetical protein
MRTILKSAGSIWKLFSALAAADFTSLAMTFAFGVGVNLSKVNASSTFLPRTIFTSGRTLPVGRPVCLATALTSTLSPAYIGNLEFMLIFSPE